MNTVRSLDMNALFFLIIASVTVAIGFLIAFIWAVKSGQFEDRYTPAVRMLFDDPADKKGINGETNTEESDTDS